MKIEFLRKHPELWEQSDKEIKKAFVQHGLLRPSTARADMRLLPLIQAARALGPFKTRPIAPLAALVKTPRFEKAINDSVAPITQAWTNFEMEKIIISPGDIQDNAAMFTLIVSAKRRKHGTKTI